MFLVAKPMGSPVRCNYANWKARSDIETDPMQIAERFYELDAHVKSLELSLTEAKNERKPYEAAMLDLFEQGKLPHSFKHRQGSIYLHTQVWASAKNKDHEKLTDVLKSLGLIEFLPKTVNSQSLSAYVREFRDELGQVKIGGSDGLPQELADVLSISERASVRATGN